MPWNRDGNTMMYLQVKSIIEEGSRNWATLNKTQKYNPIHSTLIK